MDKKEIPEDYADKVNKIRNKNGYSGGSTFKRMIKQNGGEFGPYWYHVSPPSDGRQWTYLGPASDSKSNDADNNGSVYNINEDGWNDVKNEVKEIKDKEYYYDYRIDSARTGTTDLIRSHRFSGGILEFDEPRRTLDLVARSNINNSTLQNEIKLSEDSDIDSDEEKFKGNVYKLEGKFRDADEYVTEEYDNARDAVKGFNDMVKDKSKTTREDTRKQLESIKGVGHEYSKDLINRGIKNTKDFIENDDVVKEIIDTNITDYDEMVESIDN